MDFVKITKKNMERGVPYLTKSAIKSPERFCTMCNQLIGTADPKLGICLEYTTVIYCTGCMLKAAEEHRKQVIELIEELEKLDESRPYENGNYISSWNFAYKALAARSVLTVYKSVPKRNPHRTYLDVQPDGCEICNLTTVFTNIPERVRDPQSSRGYWDHEDGFVDKCNYILIDEKKYCKAHAIERVKAVLALYDEFITEVPKILELKPKHHGLKFATKGRLFSENSFTVENVERGRTCTKCRSRLERTCIRFDDTENKDLKGLCIKCAEDYLQKKLEAARKALEHLQEFKEDRCGTCPRTVQTKCVTKGVVIPLECIKTED